MAETSTPVQTAILNSTPHFSWVRFFELFTCFRFSNWVFEVHRKLDCNNTAGYQCPQWCSPGVTLWRNTWPLNTNLLKISISWGFFYFWVPRYPALCFSDNCQQPSPKFWFVVDLLPIRVGSIVPRDINTLKKALTGTDDSLKVFKQVPKPFTPKYVCECGKQFKRNQSLNNHRNFVCGKVKQRYCPICKKFFWAHQQLLEHQRENHS